MDKVKIRRFEPADQDGVATLIVSIQNEEFGIAITAEDQPDLQEIPEFYQRDSGYFWVAETADGEVVGTIALRDIGDGAGALRKMFVHPEHRGARGLARALLDTLLAHARALQLSRIYLGTTDRFLAAHRFYARNGFALIDHTLLPPTFPRMMVDTRFYALTL
jgi:N-acetylglutamate synthase-like GNAT family acetyltransferase